MSDFYVSLIPTDVNWQSTRAAAAEAEAYVRRVFPDPDGVQQDATVEFDDRITVVDAGENIQQITCPRCDHDIPLDWYGALLPTCTAATSREFEIYQVDGQLGDVPSARHCGVEGGADVPTDLAEPSTRALVGPGRSRWRVVTSYSSGSPATSRSNRRRSPSSFRESTVIRP
ncbi:hypothetical protein [Micromonospora sp. SL4-19]|uniref:hypothetical protein n=1 Tax=Micromonospora sp. SL4-19 TaxID=3399129 RepID=UPI003A4E0C26